MDIDSLKEELDNALIKKPPSSAQTLEISEPAREPHKKRKNNIQKLAIQTDRRDGQGFISFTYTLYKPYSEEDKVTSINNTDIEKLRTVLTELTTNSAFKRTFSFDIQDNTCVNVKIFTRKGNSHEDAGKLLNELSKSGVNLIRKSEADFLKKTYNLSRDNDAGFHL